MRDRIAGEGSDKTSTGVAWRSPHFRFGACGMTRRIRGRIAPGRSTIKKRRVRQIMTSGLSDCQKRWRCGGDATSGVDCRSDANSGKDSPRPSGARDAPEDAFPGLRFAYPGLLSFSPYGRTTCGGAAHFVGWLLAEGWHWLTASHRFGRTNGMDGAPGSQLSAFSSQLPASLPNV